MDASINGKGSVWFVLMAYYGTLSDAFHHFKTQPTANVEEDTCTYCTSAVPPCMAEGITE
jgi:hypothetical protein